MTVSTGSINPKPLPISSQQLLKVIIRTPQEHRDIQDWLQLSEIKEALPKDKECRIIHFQIGGFDSHFRNQEIWLLVNILGDRQKTDKERQEEVNRAFDREPPMVAY